MIPPKEWEKTILQPAEMFIAGTGKRINKKTVFLESLIKSRGKK